MRTLADGTEAVIREARSVDDQIEWLDEDTIPYGLGRSEAGAAEATTDVWAAPPTAPGSPSC